VDEGITSYKQALITGHFAKKGSKDSIFIQFKWREFSPTW